MQTISICVVTKNEAHNIVDCLDAVSWADEIIVIDSESTDNTVELCKQFTNKVIVSPWLGCGPQKKQVFELATCDWVLMLDADERVTPELAAEIKQALKQSNYNGYEIPFQSYFCGKQIRYGDWMNEKHLRLFRRSQGEIIPRLVHFGVKVNGRIGKMKNRINHFSFPNLHTVINKMNSYSTDGARHKFQQGKTASIWSALGHGTFAFIRGYILRFGFLDGRYGYLLAIANAQGSYYKYLKLIELQKN
jgi:glycosyltransferase involved in cell wall biosynthesis